jgi:hypothetical protein
MSGKISGGNPGALDFKSLAIFWGPEILEISGMEIPEPFFSSSFSSNNYSLLILLSSNIP